MSDTSLTSLELINRQGVSIVIGARDEEKTVALTIGHLTEELWASGITKWEIILMDNSSRDETSRFFSWKLEDKSPPKYIYSPRGMVTTGRLRIFYDPIMSNVGTRNKGVQWAKYENIIFADAHIITRPGTILSTLTALNTYGGIIHAPVSWLGADTYSPEPSYQYSYKVGEKIWGTWNKAKVADTPFYIPLSGHCWVGVRKKEFLEKGGYPYAQRVYGGGEPYLDTVFWMTGSTSMCDPGSLVYHLSAGRGYSWHSDDLLHNMLLVSYVLGGEKWLDRIMITYTNKIGVITGRLSYLYEIAKQEGEEMRGWLEENKVMSFEDLLGINRPFDCDVCTKRGSKDPHTMRIWDKKNDELHGKHRSFVTEFELQDRDGKIFIGETEITAPQAIDIAKKYL